MHDALIELLAGRRGHFQMESGYHSEWWYDLNSLFQSSRERLQPFVSELSRRISFHRPEAICGPMSGGAKLAEMIAAELGAEYFFTERHEHVGRPGLFPVEYRLPEAQRAVAAGKTFALVDDAISAGSAVRGTQAALLACGARTVSLGALFVFGEPAKQFAQDQGIALDGIAQLPFELWKPEHCPLCRAGSVAERVSDAV